MTRVRRTALVILTAGVIAFASELDQARQQCQAGNFSAAKQIMQSYLNTAPNSVEGHALLAFADWKSGDIRNAVIEYQTAIRLDNRSFSAHYNLGMLYLEQHDSRNALDQLLRASELDPDQPNLEYNTAVLLLDNGHPKQALNHLLKARTLEPGRPDTTFQIVRAYMALHQPEKAKQESDDLKQKSPESVPALARVFIDAGDFAQAIALFPNPDTAEEHALLAEAFYAGRDVGQALRESREAVEQEPTNAKFLLLRARILQRAGSPEAATLIDRAITSEPNWFEPYYSRAVSYYLDQNYAAADRALSQALALDPGCARCEFLFGVAKFNQGQYPAAETSLKRAAALSPGNARYHTHLATLYLSIGKTDFAVSELKKAIASSPDYAFAHYELGKYLATISQLEAAVKELETACRLDPQLTQAEYQLAQVYKKLGRQADAQKILSQFRYSKEREQEEISFRRDLEPELAVQ